MKQVYIKSIMQKRSDRIFLFLLLVVFFSIIFIRNQREIPDTNLTELRFVIPRSSDPDAFLSVWNTSKSGVSAANQVKLPLQATGSYNFEVDWGDGGPTDVITAWNSVATTHTYSVSGVYLINITGTIVGWKFSGVDDKLKIVQILQWGCLRLGNSSAYFAGCRNLELKATDSLDLTGTTTLYQAFWECANLGDEGDMRLWDVSKVTDMSRMFYKTTSFNQPIGNWNVSSVTDMSFMFYWATSFNQSIGNWTVSNVVNMNSMFWNATSFNQPIANWDVSSVTQMQWMFTYASSFNQPIGNWTLSHGVSLTYMFYEATSFNQSINDWDIVGVIDLTHMFYRAYAFNQPLDKWNVSGITNMDWLFANTPYFNQSLASWDVSNVTDMNHMFYQADAFNQPLDTWNVSKVTHMEYMFYAADSFNQSLNNWNVSSVTDMNHMFYYALSFNQPLDAWEVSHVKDMSSMFDLAFLFNQSLNTWDTSAVLDMNHMFYEAKVFNQPVDNWIVSSVTNMDYMFYRAYAFNQPIGNWDVSNVSSMDMMLYSNALTKENYDNLLVGWSQLFLQTGVDFYAGNTKYSSISADERQCIIDTYGWTIVDGGFDPLPDPFILTSDAGNPDDDGNFLIFWSASYGVSNYSVYQHDGYITEFNTTLLSIASETTDLSLSLTDYVPDMYYFVVIANNEFGTRLSNCLQVVVDYSDTLIITYPNSTARLLREKAIFIHWTSTGDIENVKLELYRGDAFVLEIIASTPNSGMYGWSIPSNLEQSTEYRIKISDPANPYIFSYSDYFEIYSNKIPGYNIFLITGLIAIVSAILVLNNKKSQFNTN